MGYKVLIVEDDPDMGDLLQSYLDFNGFEVKRVYNGEEGRAELLQNNYDVLVVDIMMPREDGLLFAKKLKDAGNDTPFVFLTARKMQEDIIKGLQLGADDYILKPFDPDELILRIGNILRRTQQQFSEKRSGAVVVKKKQYQVGTYLFEPSNLLLSSSLGSKILTEKESDLLLYLVENSNRLIKRDDILNYLWEEADFFKGRSMDVFISRLRKYLAEDRNIQIESVRGIGFRFIV